MLNPKIEEFAKLLIEQVRDAAIQECDRKLRSDARGPIAQRWKKTALETNFESIASAIIPDIVDNVIFQLCRAIDQEELTISFSASDGEKVDLSSDGLGELAGWYMGVPGWRTEYSKERFYSNQIE